MNGWIISESVERMDGFVGGCTRAWPVGTGQGGRYADKHDVFCVPGNKRDAETV